MATLDAHIECEKQAAVADRLVITKTDLINDPISKKKLERGQNTTLGGGGNLFHID